MNQKFTENTAPLPTNDDPGADATPGPRVVGNGQVDEALTEKNPIVGSAKKKAKFRPWSKKGDGNYSHGERHENDELVADYVYYDEHKEPHQLVLRYEWVDEEGVKHKSLPQAHWDPTKKSKKGLKRGASDPRWVYGLPENFVRIPYMLPQLVAAPLDTLVLICEGEKDTESAIDLGFTATTNSGGAGKWTAELNKWFKDRIVVIV
jgi:hypothetical protein